MSSIERPAEGERAALAEAFPWEDPRRALRRHGGAPKRAFSQNFLVARPIVEAIAEAAAVGRGQGVVELGPGVGTLSAALLRRGARVLAVELDPEMIAILRADLERPVEGSARFQVIEGDATRVDLAALAARLAGDAAPPEGLVVVGNLPYAVTGAILENLVAQRAQIARAIVMIQKEVRDRLLASPGTKAYGALTVFVRAAYRVEPVLRAPAGAFHPAPKVESAVVRLVPREAPIEETPALRLAVRACFEQRRKTLRNGLVALLGAEGADRALEAAHLDGKRRGETLSLEEIAALAAALPQPSEHQPRADQPLGDQPLPNTKKMSRS